MARRRLSFFTMAREHDNEDLDLLKQCALHISEQFVNQYVSRLCQGITVAKAYDHREASTNAERFAPSLRSIENNGTTGSFSRVRCS